MKTIKMNIGIRIMLFVCSLLVTLVLFKPIWKIDLNAPQYPEGLGLTISADGLGGDVDIINGLNHYIGMATLHTEDFIEFKVLPFLIVFFALFFLVTAIIGNRKLMYVLFVSFVIFGIVAMVDFWRWEYNYGHNLDPNAAIIVPGMAYQPPLIGYKQLLNFGAYSVPALGGWLFISSGILLLTCIIVDYKLKRKVMRLKNVIKLSVLSLTVLSFSGCNVDPDPIKIGSDNCHYCKMTISDNKYGAEIITKKGKIFKYDEMRCMLSEINTGVIDTTVIKDFYFVDFCNPVILTKNQNSFYLKSEKIKGPMGGNIAVFSSRECMLESNKQFEGEEVSWEQIFSAK